ncbi:MAG TPA: sigma 54-interacting transcriptional regulator [Anaeromyxobacteraceae bacterium]|nr:sigma 54-interacting transcriptional regulator [Anaeromyxobacteraceae bacterium]
MAELALFRHGEELLRVPLHHLTTIGRDATCDVSLPDATLSRVQAIIERRDGAYWLVDRSGGCASAEAEAVPATPLADGAEVALGTWRALFRATSAGAEVTRVEGGTSVRRLVEAGAPPVQLRIRERGRERVFDLSGASAVTVGKDDANDITLDDPFVSARHLRLERRGAAWRVRDLGSTNGTWVQGVRVADAELPIGAPIALGQCAVALEPVTTRAAEAPAYEGMISSDSAMRQVFELVERVAASDASVAILGETGTGKELVARALHARSPRAGNAFIPVNCSAIAETLIESELFGHEKGAFSGAEKLRKGAFEEADGGTIFLDEIGELSFDLQAKLLRTLELGEVKRVGSSRPITVNVRVVAATHRDLRAQIRAGKFREDLFYRLCVVPITIPPLRRRRADIRSLAQAFLDRAAPRGLAPYFTEDAFRKLEEYDWPGNVRQLKNVVVRGLLFRGEGVAISPGAVTFEDTRTTPTASSDDDTLHVRGLTMEEIEREAIRLSLRRNKGKRAAVVRELQIAKSTVLKRITQWEMQDEGRPAGAPLVSDDDEE